MKRVFVAMILGVVAAVSFVLPASATAGSFRVTNSSEYGVVVWDGRNCTGPRHIVMPGHSRGGSRVDSFKVYAKKGAYKLNSGWWRTTNTAQCYNVSAAIVYAQAWD